jgi:hypothetical protein
LITAGYRDLGFEVPKKFYEVLFRAGMNGVSLYTSSFNMIAVMGRLGRAN